MVRREYSNGAFTSNSNAKYGPTRNSSTSSIYSQRFDFSASRSSAVYGNSATVQPAAINVFAVMRY